jgi:hypothetical protein
VTPDPLLPEFNPDPSNVIVQGVYYRAVTFAELRYRGTDDVP